MKGSRSASAIASATCSPSTFAANRLLNEPSRTRVGTTGVPLGLVTCTSTVNVSPVVSENSVMARRKDLSPNCPRSSWSLTLAAPDMSVLQKYSAVVHRGEAANLMADTSFRWTHPVTAAEADTDRRKDNSQNVSSLGL